MRRIDHPLLTASLGSSRTLTSLHFGTSGARPKIYIQASLHAEELPGMLVAHHLRGLLQAEEDAGRMVGEVVLVPVANPIGLAQRVDHKPMGRFELGSSENFNRHYPALAQAIWPNVKNKLGKNADTNRDLIRAEALAYLAGWSPDTELQSLRKTLLSLSVDADRVLDLHCDCEAVLHLYSEDVCWADIEPLARLLQCQTVLLAHNSGGAAFDESLSGLWWQLAELAQTSCVDVPIPQGCASTTVELRGETDVSHAHAQADAEALLNYLRHQGAVSGVALPPDLPCEPTPLAGSQTLTADRPGILVFHVTVGQTMAVGDAVADIVDPISGQVHTVCAGVAGVLYAHIRDRYATTGAEIGKIAGRIPFRTGDLLGA